MSYRIGHFGDVTIKCCSVKLVLKVINLICVIGVAKVKGADPLPSPTGLTSSLL
jgi:hypothetical protein